MCLSCPVMSNYTIRVECRPPRSPVSGISQARIPGWVVMPSPPGNLPNPGIEPRSPALQADSLPSEPLGKPTDVSSGCSVLNSANSWWRNCSPSILIPLLPSPRIRVKPTEVPQSSFPYPVSPSHLFSPPTRCAHAQSDYLLPSRGTGIDLLWARLLNWSAFDWGALNVISGDWFGFRLLPCGSYGRRWTCSVSCWGFFIALSSLLAAGCGLAKPSPAEAENKRSAVLGPECMQPRVCGGSLRKAWKLTLGSGEASGLSLSGEAPGLSLS